MKLRGLILAAGSGDRMLSHTKNKPKCLLKLAGKTLLEWQIEALKKGGIQEITVVGGFCAHLLNSDRYDLIINQNWDRTDMVESMLCAQDLLAGSETIVSYADIAYSHETIAHLIQSQSDIAMTYNLLWQTLWQERFDDPLTDAETLQVNEGIVTGIGKRPTHLNQIQGQYMGLLKFTPKGWKDVKTVLSNLPHQKREIIDMTTLLQILIDNKISIEGIPISGKWIEVDTPEDLNLCKQKLKEKQFWPHDWRN